MAFEHDIEEAIGSHAAWKMKLKAAISKRSSDQQVSAVRQNDLCPFGKWLYYCDQGVKASAGYENVKQIHTRFHKEVANVLDLAVRGNNLAAEMSLAPGGAFATTSTALTVALTNWKIHIRS